MKKVALVIGLVTILGLTASSCFAQGWHRGGGHGGCHGPDAWRGGHGGHGEHGSRWGNILGGVIGGIIIGEILKTAPPPPPFPPPPPPQTRVIWDNVLVGYDVWGRPIYQPQPRVVYY